MKLDTIKKFMKTSRVDLSEVEAEGLLGDMEAALAYIQQVDEVSLEEGGVVISENRNAVREDVVTTLTGSYTDSMLAQAVATQDGFVKVKKIL